MKSLGFMDKVYKMNIKVHNLMRASKMKKEMYKREETLPMKYEMRIDSYNMIYSVDLSIKKYDYFILKRRNRIK